VRYLSVILPLVLIGAVAVFSWLVTWLGALVIASPIKPPDRAHWTERARSAFPLWSFTAFTPVVLGFLFIVMVPVVLQIDDAPQASWVAGTTALAAFIMSMLASTGTEARVRGREVSLLDTVKGWLITVLLFLPSLAVFGAMIPFLPSRLNWHAAIVMAVAVLVILILRYGGDLFVLRTFGLLREPPAALREMVARLAADAGVQCRCYVVEWKSANAVAFTSTNVVAFSTSMLEIMDEKELAAVASHEIAHLCEPRRAQLARFFGSFLFLPVFAAGPIIGTFGFGGFVIGLAFTALGYSGLQRVARAMEVRADAAGHASEVDEGCYARALEKLYAYNLVPAVLRQKRMTHPHLYDRLLAAGVTPAYPRPAPPPNWPTLVADFIVAMSAFMFISFLGAVIHLLAGI